MATCLKHGVELGEACGEHECGLCWAERELAPGTRGATPSGAITTRKGPTGKVVWLSSQPERMFRIRDTGTVRLTG